MLKGTLGRNVKAQIYSRHLFTPHLVLIVCAEEEFRKYSLFYQRPETENCVLICCCGYETQR